MKCLVTGGAGFIGSNLVNRLLVDGHQVVVIDNESAITHENFYWNKDAENHKIDICDYDAMLPLFNGVDYVFHCAAEARIQPAIINPLLAIKTNTLGTGVVLQCAREQGVKKVIYSSTSSAYGRRHNPPLNEFMEDDCLNPYSVSKVSGEKLCKLYSDLYGLKTIILRYFNVYGPNEPSKGQYAPVIRLFLRQKNSNEPLTVVGDGTQKRDFTHVNDVVKANLLAMEKNADGFYGTVFNVGTGTNYTILEIAKMISDNIIFTEPRVGEALVTLANNAKIKNVFGWEPIFELKEYLQEYK
jgi:UDP-glucose 4-epimerase